LMTNSNFVACTTGKSAGFSPLRMRAVHVGKAGAVAHQPAGLDGFRLMARRDVPPSGC
jgi:hypothetical protein